MSTVKIQAAAKLNLCLSVGDVLPNGYHAVESLMQTVSLCDTVTVQKSEGIKLQCSLGFIPTDSRNIAYKAAELFFAESGINGGCDIHIKKRIPVCAGMGGGSADAAATLRALNTLYGKPFDIQRLTALSAALGADVPFCMCGGTAFATGVGDKLEYLPHIPLYYVLVFDKTPLSTPKMYSALDEGEKTAADALSCREAALNGDRKRLAALAANSFTAVAKAACPAVEKNISALLAAGAVSASITGKGPTAFGVFLSYGEALRCVRQIKTATLCKSLPPVV